MNYGSSSAASSSAGDGGGLDLELFDIFHSAGTGGFGQQSGGSSSSLAGIDPDSGRFFNHGSNSGNSHAAVPSNYSDNNLAALNSPLLDPNANTSQQYQPSTSTPPHHTSSGHQRSPSYLHTSNSGQSLGRVDSSNSLGLDAPRMSSNNILDTLNPNNRMQSPYFPQQQQQATSPIANPFANTQTQFPQQPYNKQQQGRTGQQLDASQGNQLFPSLGGLIPVQQLPAASPTNSQASNPALNLQMLQALQASIGGGQSTSAIANELARQPQLLQQLLASQPQQAKQSSAIPTTAFNQQALEALRQHAYKQQQQQQQQTTPAAGGFTFSGQNDPTRAFAAGTSTGVSSPSSQAMFNPRSPPPASSSSPYSSQRRAAEQESTSNRLAKVAKTNESESLSASPRTAAIKKSTSAMDKLSADDMDDKEDPDENDADRSSRRLARKAELARASRRRKKMYVQDLEAKVKKLGAKIEELQAKAAQAKAKRLPADMNREEIDRKANQRVIRQAMSELASRQQLDADTLGQLNEFVKRFVENSRERQSNVDFYLDRVQDCLMPGLQVKFAIWGLSQEDAFYCLAKGTKIADRHNRAHVIENLTATTDVLSCQATSHSRSGTLVHRTSTAHYVRAVQPCVRLTLLDGRQLTCTPTHQICTTQGWVQAQHLNTTNHHQPHQLLCGPIPSQQHDSTADQQAASTWLQQHHHQSLCTTDEAINSRRALALARLWGWCSADHIPSNSLAHIDFESIADDLKTLDISHQLDLQSPCWGCLRRTVKQLLGTATSCDQAWFRSDTCPTVVVLEYTASLVGAAATSLQPDLDADWWEPLQVQLSSVDQLQQLQRMLARCGLSEAHIKVDTAKHTLALSLMGTMRYVDLVGVRHSSVLQLLLSLYHTYHRCQVDKASDLRQWLSDRRVLKFVQQLQRSSCAAASDSGSDSDGDLQEVAADMPDSTSDESDSDRDISRTSTPRTNTLADTGCCKHCLQRVCKPLSVPTYTLPLVSREAIAEPLPTYDITVPDTESMIANGIVVHNSKPGLWTSLMHKEVGLSDAQLQCILAKRRAIMNERKNLQTCENMLKQTRDSINTHLRSVHQHMDDIQAVMSPVQLAKFYLWVENNEWCMGMLSSMFQQQSSAAPAAATAAGTSTTSSTATYNPATAPSHIEVEAADEQDSDSDDEQQSSQRMQLPAVGPLPPTLKQESVDNQRSDAGNGLVSPPQSMMDLPSLSPSLPPSSPLISLPST